ncbi:MAG: GNAT family N-acetyltransferase [Micromonosporaceae bacterium]
MSDFLVRRAADADATAAAEVWLRSYAAALPTVRRAHTDEEVRDWFRHVVVPDRETWVAVVDGTVAAVMVLHDDWLDQLYVDPPRQRHGIGDALVRHAKQRRPQGLQLWTFQVNTPAQRFYERHGFVEAERTDGATNEEHEPDIRYAWAPDEAASR